MAATTATSADSLSLLDDLIADARTAGADAADAVLIDGRSVSVTWRLGKLEALEQSDGGSIGLRVFCGHRSAIVSSADRSKAALSELIERAVAMAKLVPEDSFSGLADPGQLAATRPEIDICDPAPRTAEQLIEDARRAEDAARAVPGVTNSEGAEAGWGFAEISIAASNGFSHSYTNSSSSVSAVVLAGTGTGMERDYDYSSAVYAADMRSPEDVGQVAGERAVRRLGARRAKTGRVPVVFDWRVSRSFLGHLLGGINGSSIARGTSFLKDSLGETIFAPGITIVEDPLRPRGLRSKPVDAEGLATRRRTLIDDGRLTTWLLDLRSARQLGLDSTGHAARGVSSAPSPAPSNVWMEPGTLSVAEMIGDIKDGLFITDLFGQGVNGVTGDYSRGCSGFWIENGELAYAVNETTIAGNLKDMFKAITPANDLVIRAGTDAPTLRIDGLTVAGE